MDVSFHLWRSFVVFVSCCIIVTACGHSESRQDELSQAMAPAGEMADNAVSSGEAKSSGGMANGVALGITGNANTSGAQPEKMEVRQPRIMVYTADLRVRVRSVDSSHTRIMALLAGYDAYMTADNRTSYSGQIENTMTIRVAQPKFASLLDRLLKEAVYIDKKAINASDVTQEYVDLEARLKSRRLAEEQYREILKRATKISEVLEVQQYLNTIREEIEAAQGRMQYLQSQSTYSTISIALYETEKAVVPPEDTFAGRLGNAFSTGWSGLQTLIIGSLSIWPFWLLAALFVYGVIRSRRNAQARRAHASSQPAEQVVRKAEEENRKNEG